MSESKNISNSNYRHNVKSGYALSSIWEFTDIHSGFEGYTITDNGKNPPGVETKHWSFLLKYEPLSHLRFEVIVGSIKNPVKDISIPGIKRNL